MDAFRGTAHYYAKYRQEYGDIFFDEVRRFYALDGSGTLLDLGCGTGQLALPLASDFSKVIAVDTEPEMLAVVAHAAHELGHSHISFVHGRAEDVVHEVGSVRLATLGAAFHWMDRARLLRQLNEVVEPGGGVVIVYDSSGAIRWNDETLSGWQKVRRDLVKKYLGEARRAGGGMYVEQEGTDEDVIRASPFQDFVEWEHNYKRTWTTDQILGFLYSTSFAAPHLFGDRKDEFESELREVLAKLEPDGTFVEPATVEALFLRR